MVEPLTIGIVSDSLTYTPATYLTYITYLPSLPFLHTYLTYTPNPPNQMEAVSLFRSRP